MFRASANKMLARCQLRADLYRKIRAFFQARNVMEVETQLLSHHGITDLHIQNIPAQLSFGNKIETGFLQSSPEYAMKRLLAEGSGDIFQICKAFRNGEVGSRHNPEFTMLEWYRVDFTHFELMDEMDALLQLIFKTPKAERFTYQELFQQFIGIDPLNTNESELKAALKKHHINLNSSAPQSITNYLDLLMSHCIEPQIGQETPVFIYHFPAAQASLAKINGQIAERFEVFFRGNELANGFHELTNAQEQLARFENDNREREKAGLNTMSIDKNLIAALDNLPNCAGVAMGLDRILMLLANTKKIKDVLAYDWENA